MVAIIDHNEGAVKEGDGISQFDIDSAIFLYVRPGAAMVVDDSCQREQEYKFFDYRALKTFAPPIGRGNAEECVLEFRDWMSSVIFEEDYIK